MFSTVKSYLELVCKMAANEELSLEVEEKLYLLEIRYFYASLKYLRYLSKVFLVRQKFKLMQIFISNAREPFRHC